MPQTRISSREIGDGQVKLIDLADLSITDLKVATANKDGLVNTPSMRTLGSGPLQAVAGNDFRLSDARVPLAHTQPFSSLTAVPTTISGYGITDYNSLGDVRWLGITATAANSTLLANRAVGTFPDKIGGVTDVRNIVGYTSYGFFDSGAYPLNSPTGGDAWVQGIQTTSGNGNTSFRHLLANNGSDWYANFQGGGTWGSWRKVYDSGNFVAGTNYQTPQTTLSGYGITDTPWTSYLPLAGGTMTGSINGGGQNHTNSNYYTSSNGQGKNLFIGSVPNNSANQGSLAITNGNIHLDAAVGGSAVYLNYYGATGGTFFGNGSAGSVGSVNSLGVATFDSNITSTNGNFFASINKGYYINGGRFLYNNGTTYVGNIDNINPGSSTIIRSGGLDAITLSSTGAATFLSNVTTTSYMSAVQMYTNRISPQSGTSINLYDSVYITSIGEASFLGQTWSNYGAADVGNYSWVKAAITTNSIEIVNSGGSTTTGKAPTLQFHSYGYGGPRFRLGSTDNILYLESGYPDSARNNAVNTGANYFQSLRLAPVDPNGIYINSNPVIHAGTIGAQSVNYASTAGSSTDSSKLPLIGGTTSGTVQMYVNDTSGSYSTRAIELREVGLVTTSQTSANYAPSIGFHWGGFAQTQIALLSNGNLVIRTDGNNGNAIIHAGTIGAQSVNYATNSTRLYATGGTYGFQEANPYYMAMTYNGGVDRWRLAVTPGTPANIEVNYADKTAIAENLTSTQSNWADKGVINAVVGQLSWKNYNNNHTIFDASAGTSPSGTTIDKTNSQNAWTTSYPTLMGWNGANTFGVRVDSARISDTATSATLAPNYLPLAGERMSGTIGRTTHSNGYFVGGFNNVSATGVVPSPIYTIGDNYKPSDTALLDMYGIGYAEGGAAFLNIADLGVEPSGWGQYVAADGNARIFLEAGRGDIYAKGIVYAQEGQFRGNIQSGNGYIALRSGIDNKSAGVPWYGLGYIGATNFVNLSGYFGLSLNTASGTFTMDSTGVATFSSSVTANNYFSLTDYYTPLTTTTIGSGSYRGNSFSIRNGAVGSESLNFDVYNRSSNLWNTPLSISNSGTATFSSRVTTNNFVPDTNTQTSLFGMFTSDGRYLNRNWHLNDGAFGYGGHSQYRVISATAPLGKAIITTSNNTGDRHGDWLPIDPTKTYKVSIWVKQDSGTSLNYLSLSQQNASFTEDNGNGQWGMPYYVAYESFPTVWTEKTMTIGPAGSGAQYTFATSTRFVQLGALLNYAGTGTVSISSHRIEEIVNTLQANLVGLGNATFNGNIFSTKAGNTYTIDPHSAGVNLHSTANIAPHYQTNFSWYTGAIGSGTLRASLDNIGNFSAASFTGGDVILSGLLYLNKANSGNNSYHELNRNAISTENMFTWKTGGVNKWYFGQRSNTGTDSFSLYNVATAMDAMLFSDIGNVTFRNDVTASYYYGSGIGLTGTAGGLNIGGSSASTLRQNRSYDELDLNTTFRNTPAGTATWHDGNSQTNAPEGGQWFNTHTMRHSNSANFYGTQQSYKWGGGDPEIYVRQINNEQFGAWARFLSDKNIGEYAPTKTGVGASGTWGINVTGSSATAGLAYHLSTSYIGDQQLNPQTYFNMGIGLKVAMTAAAGFWSDTLWINGYSGTDVKNMCAMHFQRDGTPRAYISTQLSDSTSYGTQYEIISAYNIASQSVASATNSTNSVNATNANNVNTYNGRTDGATYPITWTNGNFNSPLYSCDAIRIQSSIGEITANSYRKNGGTSSQFLMADGSVSTGVSNTSLLIKAYRGTVSWVGNQSGVAFIGNNLAGLQILDITAKLICKVANNGYSVGDFSSIMNGQYPIDAGRTAGQGINIQGVTTAGAISFSLGEQLTISIKRSGASQANSYFSASPSQWDIEFIVTFYN
jgi:hypothetical protein